MDNRKGPLSWLKKWLPAEAGDGKKSGKIQYMLIVLLMGAAFMLAGNILFKDTNGAVAEPTMGQVTTKQEDVPAFGIKKSSKNNEILDYEKKYETQMKEALEEMLGVKDVTVVVNIDSTEKKVLEKNKVLKNQKTKETDREGGQREVEDSSVEEHLVIIRNGEKEVPIIVETKKPEIRGVLVVAKGAENIQVKKWIREAVTRALDVPSHRVSVMPKK